MDGQEKLHTQTGLAGRLVTVSTLIFYRDPTETGITTNVPYSSWYGACFSHDASLCSEDCFEASVDFIKCPLFEYGSKCLLFKYGDYKVIYTDLWRYSINELYSQIENNTKDFYFKRSQANAY